MWETLRIPAPANKGINGILRIKFVGKTTLITRTQQKRLGQMRKLARAKLGTSGMVRKTYVDGNPGVTAEVCDCSEGASWDGDEERCSLGCEEIKYTDGADGSKCKCVENFVWVEEACLIDCSAIDNAEEDSREGIDVCSWGFSSYINCKT